jgi:hypothetical protein
LYRCLFATKNYLFEQKNVIFAIDPGLLDEEDVIQDQLSEMREVVAFPVLDAALQLLDGLLIFSAALCLVDLVSDSFCGRRTFLELVIMWVLLLLRGLDQRLPNCVLGIN